MIDTQLIKRMLQTTSINITDLNTFITEYIFEKKGKYVTSMELSAIVQLIQMGSFNLRHALQEAAQDANLTVMSCTNNLGQIIYTNVY